MNISACIITKNEEDVLKECLKSLNFVDEIIVIDSQSTDNTTALCKKNGAKVFIRKFDDFASLRNFASLKAAGDWLLYIDADERVSDQLREEIKKAIVKTKKAGFFLRRKNFYLGKEWPGSELLLRLIKKKNLIGWFGKIHESAKVQGETAILDKFLVHNAHRSLSAMLAKTNIWSETEAQLRFLANHPKITWWRIFRIMLTSFYGYYIRQRGFTVGTVGLIESMYQVYSNFIIFAKLWEKQNRL